MWVCAVPACSSFTWYNQLSLQSWVSMFSWPTVSSQQQHLIQNKNCTITQCKNTTFSILLNTWYILYSKYSNNPFLFGISAGVTVLKQQIQQKWHLIVVNTQSRRSVRPCLKQDTPPPRCRGWTDKCVMLRSWLKPRPLLDLFSQRSAGWRPQQGVRFHERDWCYISNKAKRLEI